MRGRGRRGAKIEGDWGGSGREAGENAGGRRVTDMAMDLSVIAAVLSSNVVTPIEQGLCMAGEVGLSGEVRPVARIEQRISEAEKLGFNEIIIPRQNMQGLGYKKYNIQLLPVRKVEEVLRLLFG